MKRLFATLAALLALACASPATATVHRLMAYIPPPSPLPATQTVNFGIKTLVGFGGSPMGYASPQLLGQTRWLGITAQVNASSGSVTIFCIDDRNMLVPKSASGSTCAPHTGTGAYGGAWSAPATGPYTVTVAEYRDALRTDATGASTVITVPIVANAATAREMTSGTSAWGSCATNCEVLNPDGGTGSFNGETNQLSQLVKTGGPICLGDTIYLRDAGNTSISPTKFNPGQAQYDVRPKTLANFTATNQGGFNCTGAAGRINFISETIDASTDGFGLPALQHGFRYGGGIRFNVNDFGAGAALPFDFTDVYCYEDRNAVVATPNACFTYNSTTAGTGGVGLYSSRCEITVTVTAEQFCMNSYGATEVDDSRFIYTGITVRAQSGTLIAQRNVGQNIREDMFSLGCGLNNHLASNFMFNPSPRLGVHQDFMQSVGCAADVANFGTEEFNIEVLNDNAALAGVNDAPQCQFNGNPTVGFRGIAGNALVRNNICYSLTSNGVTYSFWDHGTINFNTTLTMANPTGTPVSPVRASLISVTTNASPNPPGSISGTQVTFTGNPGTLQIGMGVTGSGVAAGTYITGVSQQWTGALAIATVNNSQTIASETLSVWQSACCNLTLTNNLANGYSSFAGQPGTVTNTNSGVVAWTGVGVTDAAVYHVDFPALVTGPGPMGVTNRAAAILQFAPAYQTGDAYNGDGSYSGALTPPDSGGHPCWNTGLTNFSNAQTCAAQGLAQAA